MKKLHWTPEAIQDREAIYDYMTRTTPSLPWRSTNCLQRRPAVWLIIPTWVGLVVSLAPAKS